MDMMRLMKTTLRFLSANNYLLTSFTNNLICNNKIITQSMYNQAFKRKKEITKTMK